MRALAVAMALSAGAASASWCAPGQDCWPTAKDFADLKAKLNPEAKRVLTWPGPPAPLPSAVPIYSPGDQPLYGWGATNLEAMFVLSDADNATGLCFKSSSETRGTCLAALRNNPMELWRPLVTVYALEEAHVQAAVRFAVDHSLCVSVAGTGHDFMNRHSCPFGVLVRTTLMSDITMDDDAGTMTLGAGCNFNQAEAAASARGRFVASGWGKTVGMAGWSMGGGHGPFANAVGLGVDQVVSARVVTANGTVVRAAADENSDLLWALRGGGGSAFGILTSITVRTHVNPAGGFVLARAGWSGSSCADDRARFEAVLTGVIGWMGQRGTRWSGLSFVEPKVSSDPSQCGGNWTIWVQYAYLGNETDGAEAWTELINVGPGGPAGSQVMPYKTWYAAAEAYPLETITPVPWAPSGVPSVLLDNATAQGGALVNAINAACAACLSPGGACPSLQLYHDVAGAHGSPRSDDVSISPAFRGAFIHLVYGAASNAADFEALGDGAYLSESDYAMPESAWRQRYWGASYPRLAQVKRDWDPKGVFWCRRCVDGKE